MDLHPFDLASIMTPREEVLRFKMGALDSKLVNRAVSSGFDHAPIVNEVDEIVGIAKVQHLDLLLTAKSLLGPTDFKVLSQVEKPISPMQGLLSKLAVDEIVVIGHDATSWLGLVHRSDIDKHPFRAALYPKISQIEIGLARMIEGEFENPWDWFRNVSEAHRSSVIGSWELAKRDRNDSNPVVWLGFPDLLNVAKDSENITSKLGLSKRWFDRNTEHLKIIRNQVMHPVRSFGPTSDELRRLNTRVQLLLQLQEAVAKAT